MGNLFILKELVFKTDNRACLFGIYLERKM